MNAPTAAQRVAVDTDERLDKLEREVKGLQDTFFEINKSIQDLTEAMKKRPEPTQAGQMPKSDGLVKGPKGNFVLQNPYDPEAMIEIALLPREGIVPAVMQFPDPNDTTGQKLLSYTFRLDDKGRAHYFMPLMFAKAQLRNQGGLKFVLVSPSELPIEKKGPKLNTERYTITANTDFKPIFER
jgi:hypothetical protein